jgi:hypothetical protein
VSSVALLDGAAVQGLCYLNSARIPMKDSSIQLEFKAGTKTVNCKSVLTATKDLGATLV